MKEFSSLEQGGGGGGGGEGGICIISNSEKEYIFLQKVARQTHHENRPI